MSHEELPLRRPSIPVRRVPALALVGTVAVSACRGCEEYEGDMVTTCIDCGDDICPDCAAWGRVCWACYALEAV